MAPANVSNPGVVSIVGQSFAGQKNFQDHIAVDEVDSYHPTPVRLLGQPADGASAVGVISDCTPALATTGAKVHSFRNNATEKAYVDKDGGGFFNNGILVPTTDSSGTPGNATINKPRGRSAIASAASACVITNSLCAATSGVFVQDESGDSTGVRLKVVPAAGSFTVTCMNATGTPTNATATLKFSWFLVN